MENRCERSDCDYDGRVFGEWTVIEHQHQQQARCLVVCSCGSLLVRPFQNIREGRSKSCGCVKGALITVAKTRHGEADTPLHLTWQSLRSRCKDMSDSRYGGRGISVCPEWDRYENFAEWARSNGYDPNLSIDRIDNDGPYSPDNCRWATPQEQARNRRSSRFVTMLGETRVLAEWRGDPRCVPRPLTFQQRVVDGWDPLEAFTTPALTKWNTRRGARFSRQVMTHIPAVKPLLDTLTP